LLRWLRDRGPVAVIGPVWLGEALSAELPTLLLVEPEERGRARRAVKRAIADGRRLGVLVAGVGLPMQAGTLSDLVVEGASALDDEALRRWMATLIPTLRPGGRFLTYDATDDPAVECRLTSLYLGCALRDIVQERPRGGVLLTVGVAPEAVVTAVRFSVSGR
jgi:hypothetical protein